MRGIREVGGPVDVSNEPLTHMTIFPEPGEQKDVAKLLLELADHPGQVMTTLDPGLGFRVPSWLYEAFVAIWDLRLTPQIASADASTDVQEADEVNETQEAVKRKPGRPRKEVK